MLIHKITLELGKIASCQTLHRRDLDPHLLSVAQEALSALREGAPSASYPIPSDPEMTVSLGLYPDERLSRLLQEKWRELHPDADWSKYEAILREVNEHQRKTEFYLTLEGAIEYYTLVTMDSEEEDAGLFGLVVGSSITHCGLQGQTSEEKPESEEEREARHQTYSAVVREMVGLKPAFIAPSLTTDPRSQFGDHFAIAMLLSEQGVDE